MKGYGVIKINLVKKEEHSLQSTSGEGQQISLSPYTVYTVYIVALLFLIKSDYYIKTACTLPKALNQTYRFIYSIGKLFTV